MLFDVITVLITVTLMVALGSVARALNIVPPTASGLLNNIVMSFFMPALVFVGIKKTQEGELSLDLLRIPLVAYLTIGTCGLVAYLVGNYIFKMPRPQLGAFLLTSMFGSTAFIGVPLVRGVYGDKALLQHSFYSELGSLVLLVSVAIMVASYFGERTYAEKGSFWQNLLAVPKSGPFLGMLLGLLFYTENIPRPLFDTMDTLSKGTLPIMMFSLGLTIVWKDIRSQFTRILTMNAIKLIIAPVVALVFARFFNLNETTQGIILLDSATPAIVICLAYAAEYKLDREFASTCIFSSFFFSLLSLPAVTFFLPR